MIPFQDEEFAHHPLRTRNEVPIQTVALFFHLPIHLAADQLRVGETWLKQKCREHNVKRWPYRKVKSMERSMGKIKASIEASTDPDEVAELRDSLLELEQNYDKMLFRKPRSFSKQGVSSWTQDDSATPPSASKQRSEFRPCTAPLMPGKKSPPTMTNKTLGTADINNSPPTPPCTDRGPVSEPLSASITMFGYHAGIRAVSTVLGKRKCQSAIGEAALLFSPMKHDSMQPHGNVQSGCSVIPDDLIAVEDLLQF